MKKVDCLVEVMIQLEWKRERTSSRQKKRENVGWWCVPVLIEPKSTLEWVRSYRVGKVVLCWRNDYFLLDLQSSLSLSFLSLTFFGRISPRNYSIQPSLFFSFQKEPCLPLSTSVWSNNRVLSCQRGKKKKSYSYTLQGNEEEWNFTRERKSGEKKSEEWETSE